jgi:hypothetical protein
MRDNVENGEYFEGGKNQKQALEILRPDSDSDCLHYPGSVKYREPGELISSIAAKILPAR